MLAGAGVDELDAEELTVLPGVEELLALAEVRRLASNGPWEVVVVDCGPTAETLRLLSLPEAFAGYLERLFPTHRRVVRGLLAGVATFVTYLIARHHYPGEGALDAETSVATLTLFLISMWVLAIIARPYTWWRVALVASMGAGFLLVLVVPWLQDFFALKLVGVTMPWIAVGISVVAAAALELTWKWVDRRVPA